MEMEEKKFTFFDVPRAILFFLEKEKKKFLIFSLFLAIAELFNFVPPYLIGNVIDFLKNFTKGDSYHDLYKNIVYLVVISIGFALFRLTSKRVLLNMAVNARYRAKVWGFERLLDFSLHWHQKENTGNKAQRIITGSESIRDWVSSLMNVLFPTLIAFAGSVAVCIFINPLFALFFVYYMGVLVVIELYFDKKISILSDEINKSMENASGVFIESTSNILAVKALGADKGMQSNVVDRESIAKHLSIKRVNFGISKWTFFQIHNGLSWGIFIYILAMLVIHERMSIGLVLTYTMYFTNLKSNATDFTNQFQVLIEKKSNLGRMMPFFWNNYALYKGSKMFPSDWKTIEFKNTVFRYKDSAALDSINFKIKRNEKIGIAGDSGSGKSTMIKLFLGLYHIESGNFSIDGTEFKEIQQNEIMKNISVVLQETELFNLSLCDNITMMRTLDQELLNDAISIACLEDVVSKLPDGLKTLIGERGYALSGGERQRIGIARAIYKNAPILLLDEATSALDTVTEQKVMQKLMEKKISEKTILIVAHRLSTLSSTDRVIFVKKGKIVEEGTFNELCKNSTTKFGNVYSKQI